MSTSCDIQVNTSYPNLRAFIKKHLLPVNIDDEVLNSHLSDYYINKILKYITDPENQYNRLQGTISDVCLFPGFVALLDEIQMAIDDFTNLLAKELNKALIADGVENKLIV